ncbi:coatomer subunit beta', partial [Sphaeroforma arctica JP610]
PLRLDIRRKLSARSDRVKSVDVHPTEPWMLCSLYNGQVHIWNHESQTMLKSFEVAEVPVRCARFVARKSWIITGSDDMQLRVFNYNTLEKVHTLEAHSDYIRSVAVHPTQPLFISSSDDMLIKLWDWEKWQCMQVFEGHTHYVMMVVFNPKDANTFASASLDRTIKVWQLGSPVPNFTLEGHEKGVNCVDYFQGGEKPYLISGADDRTARVWDYQNKTCVQTLSGHTQNVSVVCFHPELPIILTGSEDGTVRVWHSQTYRLENTLNYGLERVWALAYVRGSNNIALGYDEGSIMIKLGREEPAMSMDSSGKIIWAKHSEIQQANLKQVLEQGVIKDGEALTLSTKDLGACEIYPQSLQHNPNGRFVVVCGDGEYIIYTALAWRNKSFGSALEFVWASEAGVYAVRESSSKIKVYKNFKERSIIKPDFSAEGIFGGHLLGVRSSNSLAFYDWESGDLVRRIEIVPKAVYWSENDLVAICTEDSYFILRFSESAVAEFRESGEVIQDEGIETAFEVLGEIADDIRTACWVGDCFLFTNSVNRLNYYVGGEIVTVSHLDRPMYLLGYIPKDNRVYLVDKDLQPVSYAISLTVLEYQTLVMRRDFATADGLMSQIPEGERTRVARFLEKQGFKEQALQVSTDIDHKFELAMTLKNMKLVHEIAQEVDSPLRWKQVADLALSCWEFDLAQKSMMAAKDYPGLLLLFTTSGNPEGLTILAKKCQEEEQNHITFVCLFLLQRLEECLDLLVVTNRLPEACFFARTYLPSKVDDLVVLWKESLEAKGKPGMAASLASPGEYGNLFPDIDLAIQAERRYKRMDRSEGLAAASDYVAMKAALGRDLIEEVRESGEEPELPVSPVQAKPSLPEPQSPVRAQTQAPQPDSESEIEPEANNGTNNGMDDRDFEEEEEGQASSAFNTPEPTFQMPRDAFAKQQRSPAAHQSPAPPKIEAPEEDSEEASDDFDDSDDDEDELQTVLSGKPSPAAQKQASPAPTQLKDDFDDDVDDFDSDFGEDDGFDDL